MKMERPTVSVALALKGIGYTYSKSNKYRPLTLAVKTKNITTNQRPSFVNDKRVSLHD